jgi:transposase-like protein
VGRREVGGLWIVKNEGVWFWAGVLNESQNREVEDIVLACMNNLTGFSDAAWAFFLKIPIHRCLFAPNRSWIQPALHLVSAIRRL